MFLLTVSIFTLCTVTWSLVFLAENTTLKVKILTNYSMFDTYPDKDDNIKQWSGKQLYTVFFFICNSVSHYGCILYIYSSMRVYITADMHCPGCSFFGGTQ